MERLSFTDYLATKDHLRTALNETPYKVAKYRVAKYCKLEVQEDTAGGIAGILSLKPNHELIVEWLYEDIDNPTAESVVLMTKTTNSMVSLKMTHARFSKWVISNCDAVD